MYSQLPSSVLVVLVITLLSTLLVSAQTDSGWYFTTHTPFLQSHDTTSYYFHIFSTVNTTTLLALYNNDYSLTSLNAVLFNPSSAFNSNNPHNATIQLQYGPAPAGTLPVSYDILAPAGDNLHTLNPNTNKLDLKGLNIPLDTTNIAANNNVFTIQMTIMVTGSPRALSRLTSSFEVTFGLKNTADESTETTLVYHMTYQSLSQVNIPNSSLAVTHPTLPDTYQIYLDSWTTSNRSITTVSNTLNTLTDAYNNKQPLYDMLSSPLTTKTVSLQLLGTNNYHFTRDLTTLSAYYPQTLQRANCLLNNFPVNATISPSHPQLLTFDASFNDPLSALRKEGDNPVITCYDIFIQHDRSRPIVQTEQAMYTYNSILYTINTTSSAITTEINEKHEIVYKIKNVSTLTYFTLPLTFYRGIMPKLVVGTHIYKSLPLSLPYDQSTGHKLAVNQLDYFIWDIVYPFDEDDIDPNEFLSITKQNIRSPSFIYPTTNPSDTTLIKDVKTANNIIKMNTPYDEFNTRSHIVNITADITKETAPATPQPVFVNIGEHFYHYPATADATTIKTQDYVSHLTLSFMNYTIHGTSYNVVRENRVVLAISIDIEMTSLSDNIPATRTLIFKSLPTLFTSPVMPYTSQLDFVTQMNTNHNIDNANLDTNDYYNLTKPISTSIDTPLTFKVSADLYSTPQSITQASFNTIKITSWDQTKGVFSGNCDTCYILQGSSGNKITKSDGLDCWAPVQRPADVLKPLSNIISTQTLYFKSTLSGLFSTVTVVCPDLIYKKTTNHIIELSDKDETSDPFELLQTPITLTETTTHDPFDFNIITVGTNHYGPIQDTISVFFDGAGYNATHGVWSLFGVSPVIPPDPKPPGPQPKPDPTPTEKKGLSGVEIALIVIGSIVGWIILGLAAWFGYQWGWPYYKEWRDERAKYQQHENEMEKYKPDILAITKANNGIKTKGGKKSKRSRFDEAV